MSDSENEHHGDGDEENEDEDGDGDGDEEQEEDELEPPQIPDLEIDDPPDGGVTTTYLGHVIKKRRILEGRRTYKVAVDDESLGDIALYEHKVAVKLGGHGGRPAWADDLLEDIRESIDLSSMQIAARLQNVYCVTNDYPIRPVPLIRARNGVAAGAVPEGFPETRGTLKAMTVAQLRQLVAFYQPGPANEIKAEVLKRLCVLFGMPL